MLEKAIEKKVCDFAKKLGCKVYKFTSPAQRSVPDRIIIFPNGYVVFIEFKAAGKKPTDAQWIEIKSLRERGQLVAVVDNVDEGKVMIEQIIRKAPLNLTYL